MTTIPTLTQLYTDILADLQTEFGLTIPTWGKNYLRARAAVQAAKLKIYYLAIAKLQKNIFADTAEPEASGGTLERYGRVKIGRNPFPATQAVYSVTLTNTSSGGGGVSLPAGTIFRSDDDAQNPGKLYISDNGQGVSFPTDSVELRALEAGTGSKLNIGETLTATVPLIDLDASASVNTELVAPSDGEDIEDYRRVVLTSYRLYPQGGGSADYRIWGLEAPDVEQIYPYAKSGAPNEIDVYVEATTTASTDGKGTPTTTIKNNVAARIETDPVTGKGRRPLGVFAVNVLPVVINHITITIAGSSTISAANQTLITAALTQAVNAVRPFIAGADILANKNDNFGVNNIISTILATVPGSIFGAVTMTVQVGAGAINTLATKSFDNGNIPFLESVTYA